jgi:hypothetical protein
MDGTNGGRILPFPGSSGPQSAIHSSGALARPSKSASAGPSTFHSRFLPNAGLAGLGGISSGRNWRPKTVVKNLHYPRVTAAGCYWQDHSGGFQLLHRNNKYLGHYTRDAIAKLEETYGKGKSKRSRKRK